MKFLLLFLMVPLFSSGQTVHVKDDKIVYGGKEKIGSPGPEVYNRMQQALPQLMDNFRLEEQTENSIKARGTLRLKTPHHIIRTVDYSIKIKATEEGYEYLIDSVFFYRKGTRGKSHDPSV